VKKAIRDEKGAALALALVLLVVGGLILAPLLGLMSTGLIAGQVYEKKAHEYYAADSGVEDAIWKITHNETLSYPYQYQLTAGGKAVGIAIDRYDWDPTCGENLTYRIISVAATDASGRTAATDTIIDAHLVVSYMDFSSLLDYAIISDDTIGLQPGNNITGDVYLPNEEDLDIQPESAEPEEVITGEIRSEEDVTITWPTADQLSDYYYDEDVEDADDPGSSIDVGITNTIGPAYRSGDLDIDNTGGDGATLLLTGTVYVSGDVRFQQSGQSGTYTINLNGNTIFVEGGIDFPSNRVTVAGSGCIIAVGNVNFQPSIVSGEDDFVLVMSVTDTVSFQPSGDFTGCAAGNAHVQLQPGATIDWIDWEGKGLNFPTGIGYSNELPPVTGVSILSWDIS
jgi:hypothetical protein